MRVSWDVDGQGWTLRMALHGEDPIRGPGQGGRSVGLLAREAKIELPRVVERPHPDLEALAALVIVKPWVARRLIVDRGVSARFAEAAERILKVEVGPVDDGLVPREPGPRAALAYSAGFDSAAASLLLPEGTPHIHHRRVPHPRVPNRATHWRADAIERLVKLAQDRGRDVHIVRTDFEYLVHPFPSLPHWLGFAVGPLLMADDLGSGTLALGGTLETFYMDRGRRWLETSAKPLGLDPVAESVGMPLMRPVLGVTEIGTMRMTAESDLSDIARACPFGSYTSPCGTCGKCIRKDLIIGAIKGALPSSLSALTEKDLKAAQMSGPTPLYRQAQLEFALARLELPDGPLSQLRDRLAPDASNTAWMERANPAGLEDGVPQPWRETIASNLAARMEWMSEADLEVARAWER